MSTSAPPYHGFVSAARARLDAALAERGKSRFDDGRLAAKSAVLLSLYVASYVALLMLPVSASGTLGLALLWGATLALVAFNLPHDASHGAIASALGTNRRYNQAFRLAGLEPYTWHLKHDLAHHGYTNVPGLDPDLEAWPILRFAETDRRLWFHRFQHLYAPFAYLIMGLFFVVWIDFRLYFDGRFRTRFGVRHPRGAFASLILTKCLYLTLALIVPIIVLPYPPGIVVLGFLLMLATVGLLSALVLLPSHCMEHARFLAPPGPGRSRDEAAAEAVSTTLDFAPRSAVANWLFGGFNTNAVHHLFPDICHVHYRQLTPIFADVCRTYGVRYHEASLVGAIASHFRFLRAMGRHDVLAPSGARA